MQVEISERSMSELKLLCQRAHNCDWDLILTDSGLNDDLTEDEVDTLVKSTSEILLEQNAYRSSAPRESRCFP
jgi:hypothetical protein